MGSYRHTYTPRKKKGGERGAGREKGWARKEGLLINLRVLSDPKYACISETGALLSFENSPEILNIRSALFLSLADQ